VIHGGIEMTTATAERTTRIVAIDGDVALRKGMELLFERSGFQVAGGAANAQRAYDLTLATRPDVAVMDIDLPGTNGIDLTRRLLAELPDLGVVLYAGRRDGKLLRDALACGARGLVRKAAPPHELMNAIRAVAVGGTYVDPRLGEPFARHTRVHGFDGLSAREREVLHHLSHGLTGEEIAELLFLSPETVRTHVRNAMAKLRAKTRVHAVAAALRRGEIEL
jgi:DNA-binding NarL/FixJ family response regulator